MQPVFLSLDEIQEIHEQQIENSVANWEPTFDEEELVDLVLSIASSRLAKPQLVTIFEARCRPLEGE